MPDNSEKGPDRRNFLIASIATAGASAAFAVNANAAAPATSGGPSIPAM